MLTRTKCITLHLHGSKVNAGTNRVDTIVGLVNYHAPAKKPLTCNNRLGLEQTPELGPGNRNLGPVPRRKPVVARQIFFFKRKTTACQS